MRLVVPRIPRSAACLATVACLAMGAVLRSSVASAVPYYADPDGVGAPPCIRTSPCSLATAVANATDEVILLPGTRSYDVGSSLIQVNGPVDIHGDLGQPPPLIVTSAVSGAFYLFNVGAHLRHLRIEASSGDALSVMSGVVDEVFAHSLSSAGASTACSVVGPGTIRDSVCWAEGINSAGVGLPGGSGFTFDATLRNVTAIGVHYGIVFADSSGQITIDAKNVIARKTGSAMGSVDVFAFASGATVTITLDHSNFATIDAVSINGGAGSVTAPGSGTNQTTAPVFDAAAGNFHQLAASPTIDAGTTDAANGTVDIDGEPREVGLAPDIGADEFDVPPMAVPDARTIARNAGPTAVDVLANDTNPDGGTKRIQSVTQPANGTVAITNGGADLSYQPSAGYCNDGTPTDDFTYTLNGGSTATVAITVPCSSLPGTSPSTTISKGPKKRTSKRKAKFRFAANVSGATFMCRLDGQPFAPCSSPITVRVKPGRHLFEVEAIGPASNVEPVPAGFQWKVRRR
jgi:hypothetical protein